MGREADIAPALQEIALEHSCGRVEHRARLRALQGVPRYYFHLHNGEDCPDNEGVELKDVAAAREEAVRSARSIMAGEIIEGRLPLRDVIEIADESGTTVTLVPFREAVDIEE